MKKERTDYITMAKIIASKVDRKSYNAWLKTLRYPKDISQRDSHFLYTGLRIGVGLKEQLSWEEFQKQIPLSDEEEEYYNNLKPHEKED